MSCLWVVIKIKNLSNVLFRVQSDITETPEDEVKRVAKEKFESMLKKINSIYANYNKLLKHLEVPNNEDIIDNAFELFNSTLNKLPDISRPGLQNTVGYLQEPENL